MIYVNEISISLLFITLVCWAISSQKARIIIKLGLFPPEIKKIYRPWGLKVKEIRKIIKNQSDQSVKKKLAQVIFYRRMGYVSFYLLLFITLILNPFLAALTKIVLVE